MFQITGSSETQIKAKGQALLSLAKGISPPNTPTAKIIIIKTNLRVR
jgi:hypothetical protein